MSEKLKTLSGITATGCFVFFAAVSALAEENTVWTKFDNSAPGLADSGVMNSRIPLGTSGRGDDGVIHNPTVIKDGDTYKMWYAGSDGAKYRIYFATSTDSLTWTKKDNTTPAASDLPGNGRIPMGTSGKGDGNYAIYTTVIKDGDTYKMWYGGKDATIYRIYYATSPDGMIWVKYDNNVPGASDSICTNGTIPLGESGGDTVQVYTPCVIKEGSIQEGYKYKMWYTGKDASTYRIYLATCDQPPVPCTIFYSY